MPELIIRKTSKGDLEVWDDRCHMLYSASLPEIQNAFGEDELIYIHMIGPGQPLERLRKFILQSRHWGIL